MTSASGTSIHPLDHPVWTALTTRQQALLRSTLQIAQRDGDECLARVAFHPPGHRKALVRVDLLEDAGDP
jgi:hypothetical protein